MKKTPPVLTSKQVREAEQNWSANQQRPTYELMQRAATSFVSHFLNSLKNKTVIVYVGQGNNGGDGYLIAKLLQQASIKVELVAPLGLPAENIDAHQAMQEFKQAGGTILAESTKANRDVAIDALFGSGLNRALSEDTAALVEQINQRYSHIIAVDVPGGLNADTGHAMPVAVKAKHTHSFIAFKPGLLTANGPHFCGELSLDCLGVNEGSTTQWRFDDSISELNPRHGNTHKSEHGQVRIIAGKPAMLGAAMIAAKAALNAGAGKVYVQGELAQLAPFLAVTPELMLAGQCISPLDRVVIGPGLGRDDAAFALLKNTVNHQQGGVIDADALRLLPELKGLALNQWQLTPHEGEAAALLGCNSSEVQENRTEAAQQLALKYQTTLVLKGAGSIVASPEGLIFCHAGSPAMATPGMGDCLAGIIASLLAQGLTPEQAAINGVNWHARLGALLAKRQHLVFANDIIDALKFKGTSK